VNVADLIAELQKMPQHRPVRVMVTSIYIDDGEMSLSEEDASEAADVMDRGSHVLIRSKE
jgi:hypothetical protein